MKKPLFSALAVAMLVLAPVQMTFAQTTAVDEQALIQQLEAQIQILTQQIATILQQRLAAPTGANHLVVDTEDTGTIPSNPSTTTSGNTSSSSSSNGSTATVRGVSITETVNSGVPCWNSVNQARTYKPGDYFCLQFHVVNHDGSIPHGTLDTGTYDVVSIDTPSTSHFSLLSGNNQWNSHWDQTDNVYVQGVVLKGTSNATYPLSFHVAAKQCTTHTALATACGGWTDGTVSANIVVDDGTGAVTTTGPSAVLTPSASVIIGGQSSNLSWSSTNATGCTLSGNHAYADNGSWSKSGLSTSGTLTNIPYPSSTSAYTAQYTLTCTDSSGRTGVSTANVTVNPAGGLSVLNTLSSYSVTQGDNVQAYGSNFDTGAYVDVDGTQSVTPISADSGLVSFSTSQIAPGTHRIRIGARANSTFSNPLNLTVNATTNLTNSVPTVSLSAVTTSLASGGAAATLTISATNSPSSCSLSAQLPVTGGSPIDYSGFNHNVGSVTLNLTSSGTYVFTATCSNAAGTGASNQVNVNVAQAVSAATPTVHLTANGSHDPITAAIGDAVTLSWTYSNISNSCLLSQVGGQAMATSPAGSGTHTYTANNLAGGTYTVNCGPGTSDSVTVNLKTATQTTPTVTAAPAPGVNLSASPTSVTAGGTVTLNWSATGAAVCDADPSWTTYNATVGSHNVYPTQSTTYSVTCYPNADRSGTATKKSVSVSVTQPTTSNTSGSTTPIPVSVSLGVSGQSGSSVTVPYNSNFTLSWTASTGSQNITDCVDNFDNRGDFAPNIYGYVNGQNVYQGASTIYNFQAARTFSISCTGATGATGSASVTVTPAAPTQTSAAYDAIEALIQQISTSIKNLGR